MAANPATATADAGAAEAADASKKAGLQAWLPLIANVVLMPVLAYVMTVFVLLPKVNGAGHAGESTVAHGEAAGHGSSDGEAGKVTASLSNKVLVNVAGTKGTRYLLANITLVGSNPALESLVEENDVELRDVAASVLASKTITDLEKPGARNQIRTELITAFNHVLGDGLVNELYLTDFAIQ